MTYLKFYHPLLRLTVLLLTEDDELVTNSLETMVNLAAMIDLRIFSSSKPSFIKIT